MQAGAWLEGLGVAGHSSWSVVMDPASWPARPFPSVYVAQLVVSAHLAHEPDVPATE